MSSIASIQSSATAPLPSSPRVRAADADGDNDGTMAVKRSPPPVVPAVGPTTDTKGNNVNLTA
jgi:hypothetical protein